MTWAVVLSLLLLSLLAARFAPSPRHRLLGAAGGCLLALLLGFMLVLSLVLGAAGAAWDCARRHPWFTLAAVALFLALLAGRPRRRRPPPAWQPAPVPPPVASTGEDLSAYLRRRQDQIVDGHHLR